VAVANDALVLLAMWRIRLNRNVEKNQPICIQIYRYRCK